MKRAFLLLLTLALMGAMVFSVSATTVTDPAAATEPTKEVYDKWVENAAPITDYAFTFAFVGDTQNLNEFNPEKMPELYQWLLKMKEEKNLQFVAGLGDITDNNNFEEWTTAQESIFQLNGQVPYTLVRGNHDGGPLFTGFMATEGYTSQLAGTYDDTYLNVYNGFQIGTLKYLVFGLDHGPSDDVLNWASEIIAAHPDHNVIITTHGYLNKDGELINRENSSIPPTKQQGKNDGPEIFEKLISKHENIVLVACGHINGTPEILRTEKVGDHGNVIQQLLIDPSRLDGPSYGGPTGLVALLHISADGKTVQVENYATAKGIHYGEGLTFQLHSVGGNALETPFDPLPFIFGGAAVLIVAVAAVLLVLKKKKK
jgi:predicted phosphodiesterase